MVTYSNSVRIIYFLTVHEKARVIESDELAQNNRASTTGIGAVVMVILSQP